MKQVLQFLYNKCSVESHIRKYKKELLFYIDDLCVIIELSTLDNLIIDELDDYSCIEEVDENIITNITEQDVISVTICFGFPIDDEDKQSLQICYKPITYIVSQINRMIKIQYCDSVFDSFEIGYRCLSDEECVLWGCPESWDYGAQFVINQRYWNNIEILELVNRCVTENDIDIINDEEQTYKDNLTFNILPSNTKTRRLGYLKALLMMLQEQPHLSNDNMYKSFELYCQQFKKCLFEYKNNKGEIIVTKTGASARPYIELAEQIGLIHRTRGNCRIGKLGKVFCSIRSTQTDTENLFEMSRLDKAFFLEALLRNDYVYIYVLIEQLFINSNIQYNNLKKIYQAELLRYIDNSLKKLSENSSMKIIPIKIIRKRISEWKQTSSYIEHVIMPRLHWLYDLDIIDINRSSYRLSSTGELLYYYLSTWNDILKHKIINSDAFCDSLYMQTLNAVWKDEKRQSWNIDTFNKYLTICFSLFKTLAPNRVTFSLMANYTKYMLYFYEKQIIDTTAIKNVFSSSHNTGYIYTYQEQYKDGYIQKMK